MRSKDLPPHGQLGCVLGAWSRRTSPVGGTWGAPSCNDESKLDEYKTKIKTKTNPTNNDKQNTVCIY